MVIEQQQIPGALTSKMLIEKFSSLFKSKETTSNYIKAYCWIKQAPGFGGEMKTTEKTMSVRIKVE